MVECIACTHWAPKKADPLAARQGFAPCEKHPAWELRGGRFPRECAMFSKAPDAAIEARRAFLERRSA